MRAEACERCKLLSGFHNRPSDREESNIDTGGTAPAEYRKKYVAWKTSKACWKL